MRNRSVREEERDAVSARGVPSSREQCLGSVVTHSVAVLNAVRENSLCSAPHTVPVLVNNCCLFFHRPYFELKAKYYVQLEVRL